MFSVCSEPLQQFSRIFSCGKMRFMQVSARFIVFEDFSVKLRIKRTINMKKKLCKVNHSFLKARCHFCCSKRAGNPAEAFLPDTGFQTCTQYKWKKFAFHCLSTLRILFLSLETGRALGRGLLGFQLEFYWHTLFSLVQYWRRRSCSKRNGWEWNPGDKSRYPGTQEDQMKLLPR